MFESTTGALQLIALRDDYTTYPLKLPIDKYASSIVSKMVNGRAVFSYPIIHELVKPIYGYPGIQDGTNVMLVCERDIRFDPLGQLDESWNDENVRDKMVALAHDQEDKAEESHSGGIMSRSMAFISAAVVILVLTISVIALLKYY